MFYLIYVSHAVRPLNDRELQDILRASWEHNVQIEVTGLLLYKEGCFLQLIEGAERAVRALLEKILRDPRHYGVLTLQEGSTETRQFPDWSMGYRSLEDDSVRKVPGYADFEQAALTPAEFEGDPSRSLRLLRLFREHV